jgi:hypothetical protein
LSSARRSFASAFDNSRRSIDNPDMKRTRKIAYVLLALLALVLVAGGVLYGCMVAMPGETHRGSLPPLTDAEREIGANLERHVVALATAIGERNISRRLPELERAATYIELQLRSLGYEVESQWYEAAGARVRNLEVELTGSAAPSEIVVVGAHYDSAEECPAANDNGSGVAALIELARLLRDEPRRRTVRFVAFVNEEPPYFHTDEMGSLVYARRAAEQGADVSAMLSLETIGYYSDAPGSQQYPAPLSAVYPDTGNFIAFVGDTGSRALVRRCVELFREQGRFPAEGAALPGALPGVDWSDHWSFRQVGYPALMVTDTAIFRYPHYHEPTDTPDRIDYERTARVTAGLARVIGALAQDG